MTSHPIEPGAEEPPSTRDLILDAAERQFAERGFAGVSVREIASEAGLRNQASLYHHFANKRALYEAVLARRVEPLVALVVEEQERAGPSRRPVLLDPEIAGVLVDRMLDHLTRHPHLPRLVQRAGLDDSRYLQKVVTRLFRPLYEHGLRMLQDVGGPWEAAELPHLAIGFYHLMFGYFADAELLTAILEHDLKGAAAVARQRQFLKAAARRLLAASPG